MFGSFYTHYRERFSLIPLKKQPTQTPKAESLILHNSRCRSWILYSLTISLALIHASCVQVMMNCVNQDRIIKRTKKHRGYLILYFHEETTISDWENKK